MQKTKKASSKLIISSSKSKAVKKPKLSQRVIKENLLITSWLQGKSSHTQKYYRRYIRIFFEFHKSLSIKKVQVEHVAAFLEFHKKTTKNSTQKVIRDAISSLLTFCVKVGYIPLNPVHALSYQKSPDMVGLKTPTEAQVKKMIEDEVNVRNKILLKFLYFTGLRVSEAVSVTWESFSVKSNRVVLTIVGKGQKVRSINLSKAFYEEVLTLKKIRKIAVKDYDLKMLVAGKSYRSLPVFRSNKTPYFALSPQQVFRIVKKASKVSGIDMNISPHSFRHAHATHALERGAPIHIVKKTLGHSSIQTTDKYLEANPTESSTDFLSFDISS